MTPRQLDDSNRLWTPGVRDGVAPGSDFHLTEFFGPVLGLMTASNLTEALALQNAVDYGLTAGIHSLDVREVETWLEAVQAGNLYVEPPDHGSHRATPAVRRLEALVGRCGRESRRTEHVARARRLGGCSRRAE